MNHNDLSIIKANTFSGFKSLETLVLDKCVGIELFEEGWTVGLDYLKVLNLGSNSIRGIETSMFDKLKFLEKLDLNLLFYIT